jgi:hypothetical protein
MTPKVLPLNSSVLIGYQRQDEGRHTSHANAHSALQELRGMLNK